MLSARNLYLECPLAKRKFREEPLSKNLSEPLAKILSEAMRKILNENFKQNREGNVLSLNDSLLWAKGNSEPLNKTLNEPLLVSLSGARMHPLGVADLRPACCCWIP